MAERTKFIFGGGEGIIVERPLEEMRDALQRAIGDRVLLVLAPRAGDEIVINPMQVKWLERADD